MKILSIGNSFSVDAQAYLHLLAKAEGELLECTNLFIGGCSLQTHWENMKGDLANYELHKNGEPVYLDVEKTQIRMISIREALEMENWDVVTMQQCSHLSGLYETYQPYLNELSAYVTQHAPFARQWIHQTWAYEMDSDHPGFSNYGCDQQTMYSALKKAYKQAAEDIVAPIIPAGDVIQALRKLPAFDYEKGGVSLCRDGFHISIPLGRYVLAAVWYTALTGKAAIYDDFVPEGCGEEDLPILQLIRDTASELVLGIYD